MSRLPTQLTVTVTGLRGPEGTVSADLEDLEVRVIEKTGEAVAAATQAVGSAAAAAAVVADQLTPALTRVATGNAYNAAHLGFGTNLYVGTDLPADTYLRVHRIALRTAATATTLRYRAWRGPQAVGRVGPGTHPDDVSVVSLDLSLASIGVTPGASTPVNVDIMLPYVEMIEGTAYGFEAYCVDASGNRVTTGYAIISGILAPNERQAWYRTTPDLWNMFGGSSLAGVWSTAISYVARDPSSIKQDRRISAVEVLAEAAFEAVQDGYDAKLARVATSSVYSSHYAIGTSLYTGTDLATGTMINDHTFAFRTAATGLNFHYRLWSFPIPRDAAGPGAGASDTLIYSYDAPLSELKTDAGVGVRPGGPAVTVHVPWPDLVPLGGTGYCFSVYCTDSSGNPVYVGYDLIAGTQTPNNRYAWLQSTPGTWTFYPVQAWAGAWSQTLSFVEKDPSVESIKARLSATEVVANRADDNAQEALDLIAAGGGGGGGGAAISSPRHATELDILPFNLAGEQTYNGTSYSKNVFTDGDDMYVLWYAGVNYDASDTSTAPVAFPTTQYPYAQWTLVLSKKTVPNGTWSHFDLSTVSGNPLYLPVNPDPHYTCAGIIDGDGYIHVWANMHGSALGYVRSVNPRDMTAFTNPGMGSAEQTHWTYPRPVRFSDGAIALISRNGSSGNGDTYMDYKAAGSLAWVSRGMIVSGKANNENFYENQPFVDEDDVLWLSGMWRPNGGGANDNRDMHCMKSANRGVSWQTVTGAALSMPLVHSNTSARALTTAPSNSGMINQCGMCAYDGKPHIAFTYGDARPDNPTFIDVNVHHLWWTGTEWRNDQVTNLRNATAAGIAGLLAYPTRPMIVPSASGRILIGYTVRRYNPKMGSVRLVDVTPNSDGSSGTPIDFSVMDVNTVGFELTADDLALKEHNFLRMLLSTTNTVYNLANAAPFNDPEFTHLSQCESQWGGVLTVDLAQIADLSSGRARIPAMKWVASASSPSDIAVSPTTAVAAIPGASSLNTDLSSRYKKVFVQYAARARSVASGQTMSVCLRVHQGGAVSRTRFQLPFTNAGTADPKLTVPMPLPFGPQNGGDVRLSPEMTASAAGSSTVASLTVSYGFIDGPCVRY